MAKNKLPIKVFISYSHDSKEHLDRCWALADRLRNDGVDCNFDQYEEAPAEGWDRWMTAQIAESKFVLVACTERYSRRFEGKEETGKGLGATWEGAIISNTIYQNDSRNEKFVPVVFDEKDIKHIPPILKNTTYYIVSDNEGFESLYRRLTDQPKVIRPEVGHLRPLQPRLRKTDILSKVDDATRSTQTVIKIVAEYMKDLLPGVVPRVSEKSLRDEAILRGVPGDDALRAIHRLIDGQVLRPFNLAGMDELWVDLHRLGQSLSTPTETEISGPSRRHVWTTRFLEAASSKPSLEEIAKSPVVSIEAIQALIPTMAHSAVRLPSTDPDSAYFTMRSLVSLGLVVERVDGQNTYALSSAGVLVLEELVRLEPPTTLARQMFTHPAVRNVLRALNERESLSKDQVLRLPLVSSTKALWQWIELLVAETGLFKLEDNIVRTSLRG